MKAVLLSLFALIFASGCSRQPAKVTFGLKAKASKDLKSSRNVRELEDSDELEGVEDVLKSVDMSSSTEIKLANAKFKGEESKLEALVEYGGARSERIRLQSSGEAAIIMVPKMLTGKNEALVIKIYENQILRFKATQKAITIEKSKANVVKIADCAIQKLPWTGESHETACGWSISNIQSL